VHEEVVKFDDFLRTAAINQKFEFK